jgi:hypothetical protein
VIGPVIKQKLLIGLITGTVQLRRIGSKQRQRSLPRLMVAADPAKLDRARYQAYEQFLFDNRLIKKITPVERIEHWLYQKPL